MRRFVLLLLLFTPLFSAAQGDSISYGNDFRFADGVFLSFEQFRANKPIPKNSIISNYDKTRLDFLKMVVSYNSINYHDEKNAEQQVASDKIWGYAENGAAYIYLNNEFNRITVMGSICHFTAYETHYVYAGSPVGYGSAYGTPEQQMVQLMLDTKSGNVYPFDVASMELLLKRDETLLAEFDALSKKKKKQSIFIYLRKYNEKHPLLFPK